MDFRLAGPIAQWQPHLSRARALGFSHVCLPPIFLPGPTGDVFLSSDVENVSPALGAPATVEKAVSAISALCRDHGLALLLDIRAR